MHTASDHTSSMITWCSQNLIIKCMILMSHQSLYVQGHFDESSVFVCAGPRAFVALRRHLPGPLDAPPYTGCLWDHNGSNFEDDDSDFDGADDFDGTDDEDSRYGPPMPYMGGPGFDGSVDEADEIWDDMDLPDVAAWYFD